MTRGKRNMPTNPVFLSLLTLWARWEKCDWSGRILPGLLIGAVIRPAAVELTSGKKWCILIKTLLRHSIFSRLAETVAGRKFTIHYFHNYAVCTRSPWRAFVRSVHPHVVERKNHSQTEVDFVAPRFYWRYFS